MSLNVLHHHVTFCLLGCQVMIYNAIINCSLLFIVSISIFWLSLWCGSPPGVQTWVIFEQEWLLWYHELLSSVNIIRRETFIWKKGIHELHCVGTDTSHMSPSWLTQPVECVIHPIPPGELIQFTKKVCWGTNVLVVAQWKTWLAHNLLNIDDGCHPCSYAQHIVSAIFISSKYRDK